VGKIKNKTMKYKNLIFALPLLITADLYCFSWIVELLRTKSDVAVLIGVALSCGFIMGNYYLIKLTINKNK